MGDAKGLPPGVFECGKEEVEVRAQDDDDDDACKKAHKDQGSCSGDAQCVWCASAAVPSSCYTKEDAKGLPPGVFECGKEEAEVRAQDDDDDDDACKKAHKDQGSCSGDAQCVWC